MNKSQLESKIKELSSELSDVRHSNAVNQALHEKAEIQLKDEQKEKGKLQDQVEAYKKKTHGIFVDGEFAMKMICESLYDKIGKEIKCDSYNNPTQMLIRKVIEQHEALLTGKISEVLEESLSGKEFEEQLRAQARNKIARACISAFDSQVDNVTSRIKSDPVLKGKMLNAFHRVLADYYEGPDNAT